jgi:very-short-patch-repair endonuclease
VRGQVRTVEEIAERFASNAHGVVKREWLLAAGVTARQVEHRTKTGYLFAEFRGVYRVGHRAPSVEATYMAAVLACGDDAALGGLAAAHLFGLVRGRAPEPEVVSRYEHRVPGVTARRYRGLESRDTTTWKGIPITTVPFTLTDLASRLGRDALAWAFHQASIRHATTVEQVEEVMARRPNLPGRRNLVWVLRGDVHVTASGMERKFLARLRREKLPPPQTNRPVGGRYVDCRWPDLKLTVELDSYRYHGSRHAWEQDRKRERQARARGDDFRRYTYTDVYEEPAAMMAELRSILRGSAS